MKFRFRSRFLLWLSVAVGVLGLALGGAIAAVTIQERRLRNELEQARGAMARGRLGVARNNLAKLARAWPQKGEVLFLLGQCEEGLRRPEEALAAWREIPASDPKFAQAAESYAALLINLGRYAPAESFLLKGLRESTHGDLYPLLRALARALRLQGRHREVSDALTAAWVTAPDPVELLQDLWQNDTEPVPVESWRLFLDSADDQDDRVWLGRARRALLTARLAEAQDWLARCLKRRPEDPAVWRTCLDLAMAAEDEARFWEAAGRIPAEDFQAFEIADFRVWLASRKGDAHAEAQELGRLVEIRPADTKALERLAVLALEAGKIEEAKRFQRRKAEIDRALDSIHKLVVRKVEFGPHAQDLSQQSAILGRQFDAHAWSLVSARSSQAPQGQTAWRSIEPRGLPPGLDQSLAFCRDAAALALSRLIGVSKRASSAPAMLADRIGDLKSGSSDRKGNRALAHDPDQGSPARLHFVDDSAPARLGFVYDNGRTPICLLPETLSGGIGLIDVDGDGWLDVYCVQGGPLTHSVKGSVSLRVSSEDQQPGDRLFRNQRDGTFRDVTEPSGIKRIAWGRGYGMGVAVGDYDNDGHPDLFITRLLSYNLFRNRGDGTFEDATERAGLAGLQENPTSAAFADLDGDGDLDLYVCHYIRWNPDDPTTCKNERGEYYYCDPAKYERAIDHVFRNDGGHFVDVTQSAGFTDPDGHGLGVVAADLDDDNRIDLFVANDGTANFLFRNQGNFKFDDIALTAGVAGNAQGGFQAGMGVAAADIDGDGRPDLLVTNLYLEGTTLYHNLGQGMFADLSAASGIVQATRYLLGFGIAVFDASNDGRVDVAITNGNINDFRPLYPFAMPTRLYEGRPGGRLVDVSEQAGHPWSVPRLGRGLAAGDLDNDGRVDLIVVPQDGPLAYFHNKTERPGHFVTFQLEGTRSNCDGVGARVTITVGQHRQVAQRVGGGSYLSACDGRLHFGLGHAATVDSVEVRWPSGRIDRWNKLAADTGYLLREGATAPRLLAGFNHAMRDRR
jgi:tetratricopeptide (TPR) repeat protein